MTNHPALREALTKLTAASEAVGLAGWQLEGQDRDLCGAITDLLVVLCDQVADQLGSAAS